MPNKWSFGPAKDHMKRYASGDEVPSRSFTVYLNGIAVGELECHLHRRQGRDKQLDLSYGITAITYGPVPGGK